MAKTNFRLHISWSTLTWYDIERTSKYNMAPVKGAVSSKRKRTWARQGNSDILMQKSVFSSLKQKEAGRSQHSFDLWEVFSEPLMEIGQNPSNRCNHGIFTV